MEIEKEMLVSHVVMKVITDGTPMSDALKKVENSELITVDSVDLVWIDFLEIPAYNRVENMVIDCEERDWVDEMKEYIESDLLSADSEPAQLLKKRSPRYTTVAEILYQRSFNQPVLRCVHPRQVKAVLDDVHKGACGDHQGVHILASKIISSSYYWLSLQNDAANYVKKCAKCQRLSDIP